MLCMRVHPVHVSVKKMRDYNEFGLLLIIDLMIGFDITPNIDFQVNKLFFFFFIALVVF